MYESGILIGKRASETERKAWEIARAILEGKDVRIVSPRGTGKTTLVNRVKEILEMLNKSIAEYKNGY